jgi:hypothetical protein
MATVHFMFMTQSSKPLNAEVDDLHRKLQNVSLLA